MPTLIVFLLAAAIIAGTKKSKKICHALTLGVLARAAAGTACRACLTLLERLLLPVLAHHHLDPSDTLLHLVTHLLVARVSMP
jgi:hypothetical protein